MDAATLVRDVEPVTHRERMRRLVDLGRRSRDDAAAKALVDALRRDADAYVRTLAVATAYGSGDGSVLVEAARDPSRVVRQRALRAAVRICSDAEIDRVLEATTARRPRTRLVAALRRRGRFAPVDRFVARMLSPDEPDAIELAALASTDAVRTFIATLGERGGPVAWARLAKLHPAVVSEHLASTLARTRGEPIDPRTRWRLDAIAGPLARASADAGLALLAALYERGEEPGSKASRAIVAETLRKKPVETFDLVRARHERGAATARPGAMGILQLDRVAHRLGAERLAWVVQHAPSILSDRERGRRWLLRLSERDREAVVDAWLTNAYGAWGAFILRHVPKDGPRAAERRRAFERWRTAAEGTTGVVSHHFLGQLPDDLRLEEARHHLAMPALETRPYERNAYAALLPFDEAEAALRPYLGHPDGEDRARADRVLIASIRHDRASLSRALAFVHARKFEQDPVRLAMIESLAMLPVGCFTKDHLEAVGAIVNDALEAADLSGTTAAHAERLVVRLFPVDGEWGAKWLTRILAARGSVSQLGLGDGLVPKDLARLAPALAELANAWATTDRMHGLVWLARSLGRRLRHVPPVLDALERLAREQPFFSVDNEALDRIRGADRPRFARLVPELLAKDPTYVLARSVARFVSTKRQDLLSRFLSDEPVLGRFAADGQEFPIDFDVDVGFGTWTSQQQGMYAAKLGRVLDDETRDVPTLRMAIDALARLAYAPRDALFRFASDPRPPVREMAIRALPWLDGNAGLHVLLECVGDDRARWAIYALRKTFSEMSRDEVLVELRKAPMNKVTVAKEVVRLLGELGGAAGYADLVALEAKSDLHRDVRIALLRALWDHLDRPTTWQIFERAVAHDDWRVASKLADVPLGRLSNESEDRIASLLARILSRKEPEARLELLVRAAQVPLPDASRVLFRALVERMGASRADEAVAATNAALVRMLPSEVDVLVQRMKDVLPRRRLAQALVPCFVPTPYVPSHRREVAQGVLDALARDPLAVVRRVRFAGSVLDTKAFAKLLREISAARALHADSLAAACEQARRVVRPDSLDRELGAESDPRLRRIALEALAAAAGAVDGWTKARRDRLMAYRADPDLLVASAAAYVFLPEE